MGEVVRFDSKRTEHSHKKKEEKVREIRSAFRAARESGDGENRSAASLKKLLKGKKTNNKGKKK